MLSPIQKDMSISGEDQISLKNLILKLHEWWRYLLANWIVILIVSVLSASCGLAYSLFTKPQYVADLTFVLEDSKGNSLGAYAGLASQFGIDMGGMSNSGVLSNDNILEFLKTRLMVEKTLLSSFRYHDQEITLADLYIRTNKINEAWKGKAFLKDLHFLPSADRSKFTLVQDSILGTLYQSVLKNSLRVGKPDKKSGFILVQCVSLNDTLSKIFVERLVKEATDFYISTKTKRSKSNVDKLQTKADSIEALLNKKTYSAAIVQDLNLNPAKRVATVNAEVATRDKVVLQTMYAEVVKNLEMSRMAMVQETPVIQIIDSPILPLRKERVGKLKGIVFGGVLGGFFVVLILILRKIYKDILNEDG